MNADFWPVCLSKRDCQEVHSLADMVAIFAGDLVDHYRAGWDLQTPDAPQIPSSGRQWYLRREAGLRAFARYEAELRLKHFAKQGLLSGADYCEARLQEMIFKLGWKEAKHHAPTSWQKFISWREKSAPGFAEKLAVWISRRNTGKLARHSPDPRIRLYALMYDRAALMYDRAPVPLEFCSEAWSVVVVNHAIKREAWQGKKTVANRQSVRRWRNNLGLKFSPHVVATLPHPLRARKRRLPAEEIMVVDPVAAKMVGLPFDFKKLTPLGDWRTR